MAAIFCREYHYQESDFFNNLALFSLDVRQCFSDGLHIHPQGGIAKSYGEFRTKGEWARDGSQGNVSCRLVFENENSSSSLDQ